MDRHGIKVPRRFYVVIIAAALLFSASTITLALALGLFSRSTDQAVDQNSEKLAQANRERVAQRKTSHEICVAINNLNATITATLERSKANLTRLDYYRKHPREADQQRREIDATIASFKPRKC